MLDPLDHLDHGLQVFTGLRRQTDHEVEFEVEDAAFREQGYRTVDLFEGEVLVDQAPQPFRPRFHRYGNRAMAACRESGDQVRGNAVGAQGRKGEESSRIEQLSAEIGYFWMVGNRRAHETHS